ncbi:hypothetical protein [Bacillus sp. FJAT-50079]|uniref:hypothetical protein n=1 Tax=Bacillus sp. FJAT-50079 TaxID=2833577 RepID=UPI001BCA3821|nr:hypothetical protein [Bacillus sp. FJAT-50079]MBS4210345.1 hypothetical protein [Bacillus sp. FJAT-50079]
MRKLLLLLSITTFIPLTAFDRAEQISISNIETTIIKAENVLRYDIKLKNLGKKTVKSEFDSPGHHHYGLEIVVRPGKKLASKMELVNDSKFIKMVSMGGGATGLIEPGTEGSFHVEYKIKDGENLKEVKKLAFDSTLLLLDGVNIIKEFPLNKRLSNMITLNNTPRLRVINYQFHK